jgi:general secretion pathway protein G
MVTRSSRLPSASRATCFDASGTRGFTLIELLACLAIIALLLSLVSPRYFSSVGHTEETILKTNLASLRDALDKYYADVGKYPSSLDDLVKKRYIRSVPLDPITRSEKTWRLLPPDDPAKGAVANVRSGAEGAAPDGTKYAEW